MKKNLLLIFLLLNSVFAFSQSSIEVKGYFGISGTLAGPKQELTGSSSVEMKNFKELGILVSKEFGQKFSITGGVNYASADVEFSPNTPPGFLSLYVHNSEFSMLSIPVFAEYELGKIFYAAAGPLLDFQLSEGNNFSDQSGFGYLAGIGARFGGEKLSFIFFPNYKRHSVITFEKQEGAKDILQEFGIQLGVGYKF